MKEEMKKMSKIIDIMFELYEMDPDYFKHAFFDMYYQMKKKQVIDEISGDNEELKRKIWSANDLFSRNLKKGMESGKAFNIAYRANKLDKDIFTSVANTCRGFLSAKKTKFKDL